MVLLIGREIDRAGWEWNGPLEDVFIFTCALDTEDIGGACRSVTGNSERNFIGSKKRTEKSAFYLSFGNIKPEVVCITTYQGMKMVSPIPPVNVLSTNGSKSMLIPNSPKRLNTSLIS